MNMSAAQVAPPGCGPINAGWDSEPPLATDMGSEEHRRLRRRMPTGPYRPRTRDLRRRQVTAR